MSARLDEGTLAALGLAGAVPSEVGSFDWPSTGVGEGRGPLVGGALVALELLRGPFAPAEIPELRGFPVHIAAHTQHPGIVRVMTEQGTSMQDVKGAAPGRAVHDPDDPTGILVVDGRSTNPVAVSLSDGTTLVLRYDGERDCYVYVFLSPLVVEPLAEVRAPDLSIWCETVQDPWLAGEVRRHAEVGDAWYTSVAVGIFARLRSPASAAALRAAADSLLAGHVDPELARPRQWARSLNSAQLATLEELGLASVDSLLGEIEELGAHFAPEQPAWQGALLDVCRRRDDAEGVRILLSEAGVGYRLSSSLEVLDKAGRTFTASLPIRIGIQDERLRRVSRCDPEAWWARPAIWQSRP